MILSSTIPVTKNQLKLLSLFIHSPIAIALDDDKNPAFVVSAQAKLTDRIIISKVKIHCLVNYSLFLLCNG